MVHIHILGMKCLSLKATIIFICWAILYLPSCGTLLLKHTEGSNQSCCTMHVMDETVQILQVDGKRSKVYYFVRSMRNSNRGKTTCIFFITVDKKTAPQILSYTERDAVQGLMP